LVKRKALIFANGLVEQPDLIRETIDDETFLVAADGGLKYLQQIGLRPHLLIGDLDSVTLEDVEKVKSEGCEVMRFPVEKDETDLELALIETVNRGCDQVIVAGALGGRLDQTLSNIHLLDLPEMAKVDLRLDDGVDEVFLVRGSSEVMGNRGDIVSLLPISPTVEAVTTEGLKYPLYEETLYFFRSRGISNEMTAEQARVEIKGGTLLCIHTRERRYS
jgi:thiamine pyrophosphokinase